MNKPETPIVFHRFALSGHCHRVELMLSILGLPTKSVDVDLPGGEHKKAPFLAKNAFGQVPVIEDGDVTLADSNAILVYLATRYDEGGKWMPRDAERAASVQRWLSVAAGPLAYGPAAARVARLYRRPDDPNAQDRGRTLLGSLDRALEGRTFLVDGGPTVADLALYAYVARAPEGGIDLEPHPAVRAWLARVESLPGFVPMPQMSARAPE